MTCWGMFCTFLLKAGLADGIVGNSLVATYAGMLILLVKNVFLLKIKNYLPDISSSDPKIALK